MKNTNEPSNFTYIARLVGAFNRYLGGGGGGEIGGSELPTSGTLYSWFPPSSEEVPTCVCFSYCKILCQCYNSFPISPGSRPLWISRLPLPLLPPPVDFLPPLLPGSPPPVPPHYLEGREFDSFCKIRLNFFSE